MSDLTDTIDVPADSVNSEKYLIFTILDKFYGFPSNMIQEIALFETVYPLPLMPAYIPGVINRYSIPYALFDVGLLFHKTPSPRNKVAIFKDEIDRIAFLIDDVTDIAEIQNEKIITIERSIDSIELTDAVCASFNWNGNDVFILDIHRILSRVSQEAA